MLRPNTGTVRNTTELLMGPIWRSRTKLTVRGENLTLICRIGQTPVRAGHAHKQLGRDENSFEEDTNTGERWMMIFLSEIMCTAAGWVTVTLKPHHTWMMRVLWLGCLVWVLSVEIGLAGSHLPPSAGYKWSELTALMLRVNTKSVHASVVFYSSVFTFYPAHLTRVVLLIGSQLLWLCLKGNYEMSWLVEHRPASVRIINLSSWSGPRHYSIKTSLAANRVVSDNILEENVIRKWPWSGL